MTNGGTNFRMFRAKSTDIIILSTVIGFKTLSWLLCAELCQGMVLVDIVEVFESSQEFSMYNV